MVAVTVGMIVATCTAAPLDLLLVVTTAVILPTDAGRVVKRIVNDVAEAAVTRPMAPLVNVTELFVAVESKPKPVIVNAVEPAP